MSEKPHFLARKIQDYQRLSARGFVCPICDQYFQHEPKLWEHAQATHLQAPKSSTSNEGDDIRKQFRNEAMEKAYVTAKSIYLFPYHMVMSTKPPRTTTKPRSGLTWTTHLGTRNGDGIEISMPARFNSLPMTMIP